MTRKIVKRSTFGVNSAWSWWNQRALPTLALRAKIIKIWSFSKLWYLSQVLPITDQVVKTLEAFSWKIMKTNLLECTNKNTLYLPDKRGGVSLVNVKYKSDALMAKGILKGLAGGRGLIIEGILKYFLGFHLRNWLDVPGPKAEMGAPHYFKVSLPILNEVVPDMYQPNQISIVSAKYIYTEKLENLPLPKIETKFDLNATIGGWKQVWTRLANPVIDLDCKDIYYKLLHDKLPVQERLFIKNKSDTPYCKKESIRRTMSGPLPRGTTIRTKIIVGGEVGSVLHTFTKCKKVSIIWGRVRRTILNSYHTTGVNLQILKFYF